MSGRSVALAGLARRALGPHYAIPKRGGGGGPIKLDRPVGHPVRLLFAQRAVSPGCYRLLFSCTSASCLPSP